GGPRRRAWRRRPTPPRRVGTAVTQPRARSATRALLRAVTVAQLLAPQVVRAPSELLVRLVALVARVVRVERAVLAVGGVRGVRPPTRRLGRSGPRPVAARRRPGGRAARLVDPIARVLARRPRWAAISGRVLLRAAPPSLRVVLPALVPVAARVLPVARAVPARAELVGPRPAARVVSPTADRAVRSARVLVVLPVRRRPERPLVGRGRLAPAVTAGARVGA